MGANYQRDPDDVTPNRRCACCRQFVREGVEVTPMVKGWAFFCLTCCDDITEAAKEAVEESAP